MWPSSGDGGGTYDGGESGGGGGGWWLWRSLWWEGGRAVAGVVGGAVLYPYTPKCGDPWQKDQACIAFIPPQLIASRKRSASACDIVT